MRPCKKPVRAILHDLQNGVCHYCKMRIEMDQWSIDHRVPLSRGGTNARRNKIGACKTCNNQKGSLTELEFIALKKISQPTRLTGQREDLPGFYARVLPR